MKIVSWNICCLPNYANLYQNPVYVIDNIIKVLKICKADVICLQEIFDTKCIDTIKKHMSNYNIIYDTKGPKSFINSGLMILSKLPLMNYGYHEYQSKCGEDRLSCKGFLYSVLQYNKKNIVIYNTHLNNDTPIFNFYSNSNTIIDNQLSQLFIHVYKTTKVCANVIVSGDFNCEPYYLGKFINTFYATKDLLINGFNSQSTLCDEDRCIDHVLHISDKDKNKQSYNKQLNIKQTNTKLILFSDHKLIESVMDI